jgi:electron transfer flavoprotein beta subunit
MNIVVPIKLVPDLVEEIVIDESEAALDTTWMRLAVNETDEHAVEQALLLKEAVGGQLTVVALDVEGVDDLLYTAAAKGADRLIKLTGNHVSDLNNYALSRILANAIKTFRPELILTGVGAHNDMDGSLGPQLAEQLGMPYIGYVAGVKGAADMAVVRKEYPGGLVAEMTVILPAVLGIQAAEKPPRYCPISRVRQAMKTATIEEFPAAEPESVDGAMVVRMSKPDAGERAKMIDGDVEEVAAKLIEILRQVDVL